MKSGVYYNMPESEYFAVSALSYSGMKELRKSEAHLKAYWESEHEVSASRQKLKAAHYLTLEDGVDRIAIVPGTWRGPVKDEVIRLQGEGKLVIKPDHLIEAKFMAAAIKKHSIMSAFLKNAYPEVSIFWEEETEFGKAPCKARIDALAITENGDVCFADQKAFDDLLNDHLVSSQIYTQRYHWQMAWYSRAIFHGFNKHAFKKSWFFVEDSAPYGTRLLNCPDAIIEKGDEAVTKYLPIFAKAFNQNKWPCYPETEEDAGLPSYAWEKSE